MFFHSEKAKEIISRQKQMDISVVQRVKASLSRKGVILEQSEEWDAYLVSQGMEATTFSDGTMIMHTKVSASGFFEELIHYGQIKSGRATYGDEETLLLLEIEAKERLIANRMVYEITDFEIEVLTEVLNQYRTKLGNIRKGGLKRV